MILTSLQRRNLPDADGDDALTISYERGSHGSFSEVQIRFGSEAVIHRVPGLGSHRERLAQIIRDKLIVHKRHIRQYGEGMPEIRNWKWGAAAAGKSESK